MYIVELYLLKVFQLKYRRVTFICGQAGVCALGAAVAKHQGDGQLLHQYLRKFEEVCEYFSIQL